MCNFYRPLFFFTTDNFIQLKLTPVFFSPIMYLFFILNPGLLTNWLGRTKKEEYVFNMSFYVCFYNNQYRQSLLHTTASNQVQRSGTKLSKISCFMPKYIISSRKYITLTQNLILGKNK